MQPIPLTPESRVLVLTGAGISAESGVPTFRASNGLWEGNAVEEVASPEGFARDPLLVWRFYSQRRAGLEGVLPNRGHAALAALEERLGDRFLLVTQNVDGLHAAAGSQRVIELHGNIMQSRCTGCDRPPFEDRQAYRPGGVPDIVFLAIGTSGLVFPAAGLVDSVRAQRGRTWLINADAAANASRFDHVELGAAGELLPTLLATA